MIIHRFFIFLCLCFLQSCGAPPNQVILISVDGLQVCHLDELLQSNVLPNMKKLLTHGAKMQAKITKHDLPVTAAGHAEMLTGFGEEITKIDDNSGKALPVGLSIFERIKKVHPTIALGSIWAKYSSYVPLPLLENAKPVIDWWKDQTSWPFVPWPDGYAESVDTIKQTSSFFEKYSGQPFLLFIHLETPDASGHAHGENTEAYDNAIKNVDEALGLLLTLLEEKNLSEQTKILLTSDHGFSENETRHSVSSLETLTIPLITNDEHFLGSITTNHLREQCEIVPTLLDFFGISFVDIAETGCESMLDHAWF